jgi:hypothetical protein
MIGRIGSPISAASNTEPMKWRVIDLGSFHARSV